MPLKGKIVDTSRDDTPTPNGGSYSVEWIDAQGNKITTEFTRGGAEIVTYDGERAKLTGDKGAEAEARLADLAKNPRAVKMPPQPFAGQPGSDRPVPNAPPGQPQPSIGGKVGGK